jgi:hypothetical protein
MIQYLVEQFKQNNTFRLITIFFGLLTLWWITIYARGLTEGLENDIFTCIYCIFALVGGVYGWIFARKWGGFKSVLGLSIAMFSLGLFAQFFGQILYNSYIYILGIEIPYPSFGDVLFFGSVILYIVGAYQLAKVSGISLTFQTVLGKFLAILIPLAMLIISYTVFLQGYEPDWSDKIVVFLDFGYPIGQAIYVSIAILALLISKDILGGMMRKPIILLIIALIVQYIADFSFSYQVSRETWYVGGTNDYLFALAYFLMAVSLFSIGNMFYKVKDS